MKIIDKKNKETYTVEELKGGTVFKLIQNDISFYFIRTLYDEKLNVKNEHYYDILCIDIETGNYRYLEPDTEVMPVKAEVTIT